MGISSDNVLKYTPVGSREQQWGLFVKGAGYAEISPNTDYPPQGHPSAYQFKWDTGRRLQEFQLLYIENGSGTFETEACPQPFEIEAGSIIILHPNVWHRYKPSAQGWSENWVSFDGAIIRDMVMNHFFTANDPIINIGLDDEIQDCYQKLNFYLTEEPLSFQTLASSSLFRILAKLQFITQNKSPFASDIEKKIKKAKILLIKKSEDHVNMQEIADSINMGYEHFRRTFKQITGLAPYQYHLELKINKAKELLQMTNLSVNDIAEKLHFENQYYFSRIFKTKTGLPPIQWKKQSHSKEKEPK